MQTQLTNTLAIKLGCLAVHAREGDLRTARQLASDDEVMHWLATFHEGILPR